MKIIFILLMLLSLAASQPGTVKSIEQLTVPQQGEFYHPVAGPKGQFLFSGAAYNSLYFMDSNGKIILLSDRPGSGYEPLFSSDGDYVYYRPHSYSGLSKLTSLIKKSVLTNEEQVLIENERDFTPPRILTPGIIAVSRDDALHIIDDIQSTADSKTTGQTVFSEKGKIALYSNGEKKILTPAGDGFYLWPSLSPDGTKLLFTKVGQGTYISTINGEIITEIGYANAPQWSVDGRWVVYMRDMDDGHRLIDSDIFVSAVDGSSSFAVTETEDVKEIYPVWNSADQIIFSSDQGIIYKATLEFD